LGMGLNVLDVLGGGRGPDPTYTHCTQTTLVSTPHYNVALL